MTRETLTQEQKDLLNKYPLETLEPLLWLENEEMHITSDVNRMVENGGARTSWDEAILKEHGIINDKLKACHIYIQLGEIKL